MALSPGLGWSLIQTQDASTSAQIDFVGMDGSYDVYAFLLSGVLPATDDVLLNMRWSQDNGSTFKSGGTDYSDNGNLTSAGTNSGVATSAAQIRASGNVSAAVGDGGASGTIMLYNFASTTKKKWGTFFMAHYRNTVGLQTWNVVGGYRTDNNAINAVRFLFSAGNITSGRFKLYGIR